MNKEIENIERLMTDKGVEFRDFNITGINTRTEGDSGKKLIVEGVPCVFDTETVLYRGKNYEYREKVATGAFDGADLSDVIFNCNHHGRVYARTRNGSLGLTTESDGLHMSAELLSGDEGHAELYRDIENGLIDKMSFAFTIKECEYKCIERTDSTPDITVRTITKIDKVYDVSAVDIPAYDTTSISARRSFDAERERRNAESIKRRKLELKLKLEGVN